jgi:hypothetical protein
MISQMVTRYTVLFISLFLCIACENKNNTVNRNDLDTIPTIAFESNPWVQRILNNYCPLDTNRLISDDNFLFSVSNRWDTSFTLIMKREPSRISGVYYETPPGNDFSASYGKKLFSINGFSFESDTAIWSTIINESQALLDSPYNDEFRCGDCAAFTIAHNFKTNFSDGESLDNFKNYAAFLKEKLVAPMKRQKYKIK